MRFDVITLFPDMVVQAMSWGVTGRAIDNRQVELACWNPRDFTEDRHRTVDDRPYGGGPGMVMKVAPLLAAVEAARRAAPGKPARVVYLSPQGRTFDQDAARMMAEESRLVLVCGRYEGVDERFINQAVDEEWSVGDFVVSGGELPALVMIDAVTRLLPGVLGDGQSAQQDSFMAGLLDYPHYTRPVTDASGRTVPGVLQSGDHAAIERWRMKQALGRTWLRRPDMIDLARLDSRQKILLDEFISELE